MKKLPIAILFWMLLTAGGSLCAPLQDAERTGRTELNAVVQRVAEELKERVPVK